MATRRKRGKGQAATVGAAEDARVERLMTGIEGFDALLTRGIPVGSSVLVEGGPGSGKTIFCLNLARNMCLKGKNVLYMSFEEPERRLMSHMRSFGWDPMPHIKKGTLHVKRMNALDISRSVEALLSEAKKELLIEVRPMLFPENLKPDILLVDSLTSIASAFSGARSRFRIYMEQLFKYLEGENITSFLIRETPSPTHIGRPMGTREEAVSFLSDGIIALYNVLNRKGDRTRALEIVKMRGEKFDNRIVEFAIKDKFGLEVYPERQIGLDKILT